MPRYIYKGPVMEFNTLLADIWEGETVAPSEKKARSNLTYQFKKPYCGNTHNVTRKNYDG